MNIDNIELAVRTKKRIAENQKTILGIDRWLKKYPNGDSDGNSFSADKQLFNLHICEYGDGSGEQMNLCGSLVQTAVLKTAKNLLEAQIATDFKTIESW